MPSLSSPPPRSRPASRSGMVPTPPLPAWDTPTSRARSPKPRNTAVPFSPTTIRSPPVPFLAAAPPPLPTPTLSPTTPDRSSFSSYEVTTPSPRSRSRSNSRLLPALPLAINPTLTPTPKSRRVAIDYSSEEVQIIISSSPKRSSMSASSPKPTPPRPRRSKHRDGQENTPRSGTTEDLYPPPRSISSRSVSPASIASISSSTISDAPTPKPTPQAQSYRSMQETPISSRALAAAVEANITPRKRDSTQRRLSALRGLVGNLDFNQPWSTSEKEQWSEGEYFWACAGPSGNGGGEEILESENPLGEGRPLEEEQVNQDHGWPCRGSTPPTSMPSRLSSQPRGSRSAADLRTPPTIRKEIFSVASSGYSKCFETPSGSSPNPSTPTMTWRASLASDETYERVHKLYGSTEVKRQEIMWEMCETEQAFMRSARTVLRLFATPLKTPQGVWISGIPAKISDLLDHLESISLAHGILAAGLRELRRKSEVVDIIGFLTIYKPWIKRLESHEWYLIHFEEVVALVEDSVRDSENVFGEFVRMQTKVEEMGSMSLGSMLLKPVQRLMKYPLFLKRLVDVTPHSHPANPLLLSALSLTESTILTLQASKAREEDFQQLVSLESRLSGLPEGFQLASRGRKLIGQGTVTRIQPGKDISPNFVTLARNGSVSSRGSISSSISSPWDLSISRTPSTCRTSAFSVSSQSTCSRSGSIRSSPSAMGFNNNSSNGFSPRRPPITRSPSSASSQFTDYTTASSTRPSTPSKMMPLSKRKDEVLTLFVFDDLVILAAMQDKSSIWKSKKERGWRVLPESEGGIGKVAEVKDWSGWGGHTTLLTLTTVPLASTPRNPLIPITNCLGIPTISSPRKSRDISLKCTTLTTISQFTTVLAQATTAAGLVSEYIVDDNTTEMLEGQVEQGYMDHPLHSLKAMGYAQ